MRRFTAAATALEFKVTRKTPELVGPAKPTPHESKQLSHLDSREGLRCHIPVVQFYRNDPSAPVNKDPVKVIREALAEALVHYYPLAGRLREGPGRKKLTLECTGEGVMFIEADADVKLEQFGDVLHPPFPCFNELLYDVPASAGILNSPLLLFQVTRLTCGGFIFALRLNHTISDAIGVAQFMAAMGEMARGALAPSVQPVWQRELLDAREPPRATFTHHQFVETADLNALSIPTNDIVSRSFFFSPATVSALRRLLPPRLAGCSSTFDVIAATVWRCRTVALWQQYPDKMVRFSFTVNVRSRFNPPLPAGYYGNAFATPVASSTVGDLRENPLEYAVELVKAAKGGVTEEYMRSFTDSLVTRSRQVPVSMEGIYCVSDTTGIKFHDVDFGWGKAAYGGPATGEVAPIPLFGNNFLLIKNKKGENEVLVAMCLPHSAMERFIEELNSMLMHSAMNFSSSRL